MVVAAPARPAKFKLDQLTFKSGTSFCQVQKKLKIHNQLLVCLLAHQSACWPPGNLRMQMSVTESVLASWFFSPYTLPSWVSLPLTSHSYITLPFLPRAFLVLSLLALVCPNHGVPQRPPKSLNPYAKAKLGVRHMCSTQLYEWRVPSPKGVGILFIVEVWDEGIFRVQDPNWLAFI